MGIISSLLSSQGCYEGLNTAGKQLGNWKGGATGARCYFTDAVGGI